MEPGSIQTFMGRTFYPLAPRVGDIEIADIAHALALQVRFAGHTRVPYTIAQHSVHVSMLVPPADALWGLLHDASEAYLVDVPRPIKHLQPFAAYRACEAQLQRLIYHRFGLRGAEPESVCSADLRMLVSEAYDLLSGPLSPEVWPPAVVAGTAPRVDFPVRPLPWQDAERAFLDRFQAVL